MDERIVPDQATSGADEEEAQKAHVAGKGPTGGEDAAAEEARSRLGDELQSVAEHEQEMNRLGAQTKGEGAIP